MKNNFLLTGKKRYLLALIIPALLIIFLVSGCDNPFATEIIDDEPEEVNNNGNTIPQANDIPEEEKNLTVELYFGDKEAISEDERGEFGYVKPINRSINYDTDETAILKSTLEALIAGPRTDDNGISATIPTAAKILKVELNEGTATVDLSQDGLTAGTLAGQIFTESIVYTATQFPFVDKLIVLLEGTPWSDGHYFWGTPVGRDDLN